MSRAPLLIEIGCEEIPARMIRPAADDLCSRIAGILEKAGLARGETTAWGGSRRLAVRVDDVQQRQEDRDELMLGPPAKVAFDAEGRPTPAAVGFARKQGIEPEQLTVQETDKGKYAGFRRDVEGKTVGAVVASGLPGAVGAMSFPKTMRWAAGTWRWVRPVHWVLALHGNDVLPVELFGVSAGDRSVGHRFLCTEPVVVSHPDRYREALEASHVIADPAERRRLLAEALRAAAEELGGRAVDDPSLLEEVADLLEWPGVVAGKFDPAYLELPRELLVTTLRHHQKCFSMQDSSGGLLPCFVAVANTDRDPGSHIRRGNEWVIGGRLEDARFFWKEDRRQPLEDRSAGMSKVVYHAKLGSYADKAGRMGRLAGEIAGRLSVDAEQREHCILAARLAKNDLATGTVGEFPELQGQVGGLMIEAEGGPAEVARGIYEHYQPAGPDDAVPSTLVGGVVSIADKLDAVSGLVSAGQGPTGSRDPFGLRRAGSGIFRIVIEKGWPLSLDDLLSFCGERDEALASFMLLRFQKFLREAGSSINEIHAVFRPAIDPAQAFGWDLKDVVERLAAIRTVRQRDDFAHLADLTKRVDNILSKGAEAFESARNSASGSGAFRETQDAAVRLWKLLDEHGEQLVELEREERFGEVVDVLAGFVDPVDRFFETVLVLDPDQPEATLHRRELLTRLRGVLTRCYDIRELAGEANRRTS